MRNWLWTALLVGLVTLPATAQTTAAAKDPLDSVGSTNSADSAEAKAAAAALTLQSTLNTCYQCHGAGGVSQVPSRPSLAGQKATYIRDQLWVFKRALSRSDVDMRHVGAGLDPELIESIAKALSGQQCRADDVKIKSTPMPTVATTCARCHGENGISRRPDIPNLAGQQRSYLRRQLLLIRESAWGDTARKGENWYQHPILEQQTARLSIQAVDQLAKYYAALDCRG